MTKGGGTTAGADKQGDKAAPTQAQQHQQQHLNGASSRQQQGQAGTNSSAGAVAAAAAAAAGGGPEHGGRGGGRPWNGPKINFPPLVPDAKDGKILLLFDLNGVLTEKTPPRVEGKRFKRDHIVRPHIEELLRLYPHFRIGVFSSATVRTVNQALDTLHAALQSITAHKGIDGLLLPKKYDLFNIVCFRDHCKPDPYWQTRKDGKDHDTIKPLAPLGFDLTRTVLVDNDDYKAADGEHENMLHVPHWEQTAVTDRDFPLMVQLILRHLKGVQGDVRPHLRLIERQLRQLRETDEPRRSAAADRACARAVAAASAQGSWGGGDAGFREALLAATVPDAAAAAVNGGAGAAAGAAGDKEPSPQVQHRMKQLALQGLKAATAAGLQDAPPQCKQLVQLLSTHKAQAGQAAAVADVPKLLGAAHADEAEVYNQHKLVLLLAAAWAANLTVPAGAFTLSQLTCVLQARGWPTAHLPAAVEAMIRGGLVKVWGAPEAQQQQQQQHRAPQQQQQQLRQQQWPWPAPPGTWPAAAAPFPAAVSAPSPDGNAPQAPPAAQLAPDCWLLLPEPRSKQVMKAVDEITSFLETAAPAAVAEVLRCLEHSCALQAAPKEQRKNIQQQQQRQLLAAKPSQEERQRAVGLAASWCSMLSACVRDVTAGAPGVTAQQLLRFVRGLAPALQQQLLGPSTNSSSGQQLAQLQDLLSQLEGVIKEVKVAISDKRQKSLLGAPWGVFAANALPVFRQQRGGDAAAGQHADPAAAAALTRYTVGVVPDPDAIDRSIRVLLAGAGAKDAAAVLAAVEAAKLGQQQQMDRQIEQQGGVPVHAEKQQLKPPVGAAISVSTHLNLPPAVTQWLVQFQQQAPDLQRLLGDAAAAAAAAVDGDADADASGLTRQDSKRLREGADAADAAAAGAEGEGEPGHKRQKRDPRLRQQQLGGPAGDAAAAAAGADADMGGSAEDDLDALYEAEEQQRLLQEQQDAADNAAAAAELALALDGVAPGAAAGAVRAAAAATAGAVEAGMLLLPEVMDVDSSREEEEDEEGQQEEEAEGSDQEGGDSDGDGSDSSGDGGMGGPGGGGDGGDGGDTDDDGRGDTGVDDSHGTAGQGGAAAASGPAAGASSDDAGDSSSGPDDDESSDWEGESSQGEFEAELGSEDDSDAWATDDEADGQLQLGITGLQDEAGEGEEEAEEGGEGAAEEAAAEQAAAEVAAAMARASAAAAAAGKQVPGRAPLYAKLQAALSRASQQGWAGSSSSQQQPFSQLHSELLQFASAAAPCAVEQLILDRALQQLQGTADSLWPNGSPEAQLFGSQAMGLALPGSDIDVVLLQVPGCPEPRKTDKGYGIKGKQRVASLLHTYAKSLRAEGFAYGKGSGKNQKDLKVIVAKVPILKGTLLVHVPQSALLAALAADNKAAAQQLAGAVGAGARQQERVVVVELQVDISVGIADSSAAVNYVQRQVRALPPLRPLLLAAKALLRESGLNEVFTGGLGSYALSLLVISHLQAEGVADPATSAMLPSDHAGTTQPSSSPAAAAAAGSSAQAGRRQQQLAAAGGGSSGEQRWDLGLLLQGFFLRFGALFDYTAEAVVVNQGGVLAKPLQWVQEKRPFLLSVEDPAVAGRDMSSGSFAIRDVRAAFMRAATTLRELTTQAAAAGRQAAAASIAPAAATKLQEAAAAAAAAAVLAGAGSSSVGQAQPQQQQQQPRRGAQASAAFAVVEDREAWSAVQADGQSQSVGVANPTQSAPATAAAAASRRSSPFPAVGFAAVTAFQQQLTQGLKQGLPLLGQLVDVVAAVGRGAAAEARRSEQARQAGLRGRARSMELVLQQLQESGLQGNPRAHKHPSVVNRLDKKQRAKLRKQLMLQRAQERRQQSLLQPKMKRRKHNLQRGKVTSKPGACQQAGAAAATAGGKVKKQSKKEKKRLRKQEQQQGAAAGQPPAKKQKRMMPRHQRRAMQQQQQQQQQQQSGRQQQQQQRAGKKRPRDGGAGAGGGGRGWGF